MPLLVLVLRIYHSCLFCFQKGWEAIQSIRTGHDGIANPQEPGVDGGQTDVTIAKRDLGGGTAAPRLGAAQAKSFQGP